MTEIIKCSSCKFFKLKYDGMSMCEHKEALPFPGPNDFCSKAEASGEQQNILNNEELLRRLYEQRRS